MHFIQGILQNADKARRYAAAPILYPKNLLFYRGIEERKNRRELSPGSYLLLIRQMISRSPMFEQARAPVEVNELGCMMKV